MMGFGKDIDESDRIGNNEISSNHVTAADTNELSVFLLDGNQYHSEKKVI